MDDENTEGKAGLADADLMVRCQAGDEGAFRELIIRHQDALLNFFYRLGVYTSADAEDLAQETLVRVYRFRDRYMPTARFTTFLYLVARRIWIDWLRKSGRQDRVVDRTAEMPDAAAPAGDALPLQAEDVTQALDALPEAMRSVVVLGIYQGLKYEEIAGVLEIPLGTVKSRMHHALLKLKEALHVGI